ncbi:hypothetical protein E2C01_024657 [Portunus trituberculatus]|uniref:Uncharacterized protein n=1 Tax=Portunus trituberculatus TaxID=210409 RepID=A0A5B7EAW5_PORTR|nr:hypothetical protein [Portunus trituberculatus]
MGQMNVPYTLTMLLISQPTPEPHPSPVIAPSCQACRRMHLLVMAIRDLDLRGGVIVFVQRCSIDAQLSNITLYAAGDRQLVATFTSPVATLRLSIIPEEAKNLSYCVGAGQVPKGKTVPSAMFPSSLTIAFWN